MKGEQRNAVELANPLPDPSVYQPEKTDEIFPYWDSVCYAPLIVSQIRS